MAIDSIKMLGTLFMSRLSRCRQTRINRRRRPMLAESLDGFVPLEPRLLLSALAESSASATHVAAHIKHLTHPKVHHVKAAHPIYLELRAGADDGAGQ